MRKRSEQVTTTVKASDNEESGGEEGGDSGDDWKPEKVPTRTSGRKSVTKTPAKRKSTARPPAGSAKKKATASDHEESEEEEVDDDSEEYEDESGGEEDAEDDASKRNRRQVAGKNHPDKDGRMELYLFKNDLTKEYKTDDKLCLWRRDGASLLQKYVVELNDPAAGNSLIFKGSSVYSCWEEKRKSDFFTIQVKVIGDKRDGKVRVEDPEELHKFAIEDRVPVDTTPAGADPTIESVHTTDEEDDDDGDLNDDDEDDEE